MKDPIEIPDRIAKEIYSIDGVDAIGNINGNSFTIYCSSIVTIDRIRLRNAGLEDPRIRSVSVFNEDEVNIAVEFSSFWL